MCKKISLLFKKAYNNDKILIGDTKVKIKNEKIFKNKTQMIIYGILFVLIIFAFIYIGNKTYQYDETDNIIFHAEYDMVPSDNIYDYIDAREVLKVLDENAVILFGHTSSIWTENVAYLLNEVAMESNVDKIYFYDVYDDRAINNGNYELITEKIASYLYTDDLGKKDINVPLILIIKDGLVTYSFDELSLVKGNVTPEEYWNSYNTNLFKTNLVSAFEYFNGVAE